MKTIQANGLDFACKTAGEGPLVLCLHGFPDTADTWDDLLPRLADNGFRAVAPFMRGYYPTAIPDDAAYSAVDLGNDALALIEAFGYQEAYLIGHDWGALAAYTATSLNPERVKKLVTVAIPHPRVIRPTPVGTWRSRHFITFQFRKWAVKRMKKNDNAYLRTIYHRWAPNWDISAEELAPVKKCFAQPGVVEASLGYYWSFAADSRGEQAAQTRAITARKTAVPTLCIVGDSDGALDVGLMKHSPRAYTGFYQYHLIPGAGHFVHREAPEQFAQLTLDFLKNNN